MLTRLIILLCSPLFFYTAYLLATLSNGSLPMALLTSAILLTTAVVISWVRFTRSGRRALTTSQATDWTGTVTSVVFLVAFSTAGFAALSTGLYQSGIGSVQNGPLQGRSVVDAAYSSYLWHLADTIPLLEIPETLNWQLSYPFMDHIHGGLTLVYTIFVVVPLIYIATKLLITLTGDPEKEK